jgi:sugar (pentulose or hexulose) kinase
MLILGLDIGSSSVKAAVVRDGNIIGRLARAAFPTQWDSPRVEVNPRGILRAIAQAIADLGKSAKRVDAIGLSVMSPAWVAMDAKGKPLTPIVTHQDRRSVAIAHELENRVGKQRYLQIAGNRPFPGGISCTTSAWFAKNYPPLMKRADLIGHLNTFLHRQFTGQRVIDRSNASFTGLYETIKQGDWNAELCRAAGVSIRQLPEIFESNVLAGKLLPPIARHFGLIPGTPMMAGAIDTSAAMFLAEPRIGQLLNVSGSTDVLALCTDKPRPNDHLLTRALGTGKLWLSVGTLAAAGSSIEWIRDQFFRDMPAGRFYKLVSKLDKHSQRSKSSVSFDPYLAGERTEIDQKKAAFSNLTLSTTREEMLSAVIAALAQASAARLNLLQSHGTRIRRKVVTSGGTAAALHQLLHGDWPGQWTFHYEEEASLRGLSMLTPREK